MTKTDIPSRARRGGRWQTLTFLVGVLLLGVTVATAPYRTNPSRDMERDLRQLRRDLQSKSTWPDYAQIEELLDKVESVHRLQGEAEFLAGTYCFFKGEEGSGSNEWLGRAHAHLTRSLALGPPDDDLASLFYRLGMAQYRQGKNASQALNWVRQGLDLGAEPRAEGYAFLIEAYLNLTPPNLNAALSASQRHLEFVDDRNSTSLGKARCLHADILYRLDRRADAIKELDLIDLDNAPRPLVVRVRLLQAICSEEEGLWSQALSFWKDLEPLADDVPGGAGRVWYSIGCNLIQREPADFKAAEAYWTKAITSSGEAAQAAGLRLGHALLFGPRYDPNRALEIWTSALNGVRVASDYKNRYLERASALELVQRACEHFLEKRDFDHSRKVAETLTRLAPPGVAEEKLGEIYLSRARELSKQADDRAGDVEKLQREARDQYQVAGDYFKQASLSRVGGGPAELYWQSGLCYLLARDLTNAIMSLEKHVSLARDDRDRAQGHYALAEAYQAHSQMAKAREHYLKVIEINAAPFAVRALFKLALVEIDARKLDVAREILVQIVNRNGPDLERDILEKTLYQLGQVLFDLGDSDEGAIRFREAIRRFPNNPVAIAVREKLADYAWEKAKEIPIPLASTVTPERQPFVDAMKQKRRGHLLEALESYQALDRDFKERYRAEKLGMEELLLWRKALFSIGDIRIDLEEYTEAMTYFRNLQQLYRGKVESLFTARQIYLAWRQLLKSPDERPLYHQMALEAIQTALRDLDEIPREREDELFHNGPNPVSREQWRRFLSSWQSELQTVTLRVSPKALAPQD